LIRDQKTYGILSAALDGIAPSKEDCVHLLGLAEDSLEAGLVRLTADQVSRHRFGNHAVLLGQIGVETAACPGGCKFCVFGEGHSLFEKGALSPAEVLERADAFTRTNKLYALFLMTMHDFDQQAFLGTVARVRASIPPATQIVINTGDFEPGYARELRQAGVDGAYHVRRLREGTDTALDPEARLATIRTIRDAGMDWYYCCEPVGPEHTPEEIVDQLWLGIEYGCFQHAAMRRVHQPGIPLSAHGQISELRLAQVVAVVTLASIASAELKNIAVHEPNLLGLTAGANVVYAESGANPRDVEVDTSGHRGLDLAAAERMLYEAGFAGIVLGDGARVGLTVPPTEVSAAA
jgi:biotin synthase